MKNRTIHELGEFGLIQRIIRRIPKASSVIVGPGDDCAVLAFDKERYQLFTCDMIVEGIDFKKSDTPRLIGRKALAVCASDIAACAGKPQHAVVSLGLAPNTPLAYVDGITQGLITAARQCGAAIVGGDVSRADRLILNVSMTGLVSKTGLVKRSGAKQGDFIFVSGALGDSIKGKHLTFAPRIRQAQYLAAHFKVHAMIDISDGLVQDLGHILRASHAGALIYADLVPRLYPATTLESALYAGEDFELLFTMPRSDAQRLIKSKPGKFFPIGQVTDKKDGLQIIDRCCKIHKLAQKGYVHF